MITNIHVRNLHAPLPVVGAILDSLASKQDLLWPYEKWPPMFLDRPLGIGAVGGHSATRYIVESYEPGHYISFRFTVPKGLIGTHCFSIKEIEPDVVQIKHEVNINLEGFAKIWWLIRIRYVHDALIEDAFDKAESYVTHRQLNRKWSIWVRFLRWIMSRKKKNNRLH